MTRTQLSLCALLLAFAASAHAITAEELAAKNVEAKGGSAALNAVQSVRRSGQLIVYGGQFVLAIVETRQRPDSIRNDVSLQGLTQVEAYDGKEGWRIDPFSGRKEPERMPADDVKGLIEDADISGPLASYKERGARIEYLGTEDIDGTAAHKIKVTGKTGDIQYVYLDPDYFLEIRVESQRTVRGVKETYVTDLGEYEKVGGVYWAMAQTSGKKGDRDPAKVKFEKVEVNPQLPAGLFSFPSSQKN
jgi:outer membrane lipoprotein-sorting protein